MNLTIRDWMVIIGVLLIAAVLVDAWRRVRADRSAPVKLKTRGESAGDDDAPLEHPTVMRELPNPPRVFNREDLARTTRKHDKAEPSVTTRTIATGKSAAAKKAAVKPATPAEPGAVPAAPATRTEVAPRADDDLIEGLAGTRDEPANIDWLDDLEDEEQPAPAPAEEDTLDRLPRQTDPEVFILHVAAKDEAGFRGDDILQILLACDLRFGDMDFFHRHEQAAGRGPIQFSVANMMQPGVFDIDRMGELHTSGLLFFVTLPGPEDMMKAFDYMLETAQAVARNLNGQVLDESRSVLTGQALEHSRQKIRDLERRLLAGSR